MIKEQLYEVEIKSRAIFKEGKKSLVTYFRGGKKEMIVKDVMQLYPQYTDPKDKPIVNVTPITQREYDKRSKTNIVTQKQQLVKKYFSEGR